MKVLIIEDSRFKLKYAVDVLNRHSITDFVHFDNCAEALDFAIHDNNIVNFDFVILDLNFYMLKPLEGARELPTSNAGAKFLWQMIEHELKTPVIVYSGERDYMNVFKNYLFPSFSEYVQMFENGPLAMMYSHLKKRYEDEIAEKCERLLELDFILDHAHNELELDVFVTRFLNSVNS